MSTAPWVRGTYLHHQDRLEKRYTDTMAFIGLTHREAQEDFLDHYRRRPEDFVGFNVLVLSVERAAQGRVLRGRTITRAIHTDRCLMSPHWIRAAENIDIAMMRAGFDG